MTAPSPADPALEAPALIGTGVDAIVQNAERLGLTWGLMMGTVVDGSNSSGMQVVCDGDTANLTAVSMLGESLDAGARVFVLRVPPSGLFIVGSSAQSVGRSYISQLNDLGTTSSTAFTDLTAAAVGPVVTAPIGSARSALVTLTADFAVNDTALSGIMSYQVTGNTSVAPDISSRAVYATNRVTGSGLIDSGRFSATFLHADLNPGVNTFTCKYRCRNGGGQVAITSRNIVVTPQ